MKNAGARVALYVATKITAAFEFLAATPGIGHARPDLTSEPVKFWQVFSYLIIYDPARQPIAIARVLHSSQDLEALLKKQPPRIGQELLEDGHGTFTNNLSTLAENH